MYGAPPVSFPAGRPRIVGLAASFLWMAGVACCLATIGGSDMSGRAAVLVGVWVAVGAVAWRQVRSAPVGMLRFDGQSWWMAGAGPASPRRPQVCLDFQSLMLLRLAVAGRRPRWLWVESRADGRAWRDLRRAVYSRAPMAADTGEPGSAPVSGSRPSAFR